MASKLLLFMGMKHCGKTTLGRRLASEWGLPFFDLDDVIVALYRKESGIPKQDLSIRDVYRKTGKAGFQRLEAAGAEYIISNKATPDVPVHRTGVHRTGTEEPLKGALIGICALGGGTIENSAAMEHFSIYGYFCYIRGLFPAECRHSLIRPIPNPTFPCSMLTELAALRN
mgnify:CR=1 FL=1